jgi:ketosteroid isomerase-like protein
VATAHPPGSTPPTPDEHLAAVRLQCRWADAVDRRDWTAVLSCFADDASTDLPFTGHNDDIHSMVAASREVIERLDLTQHHLSNHLIERAPDGLTATCYVMAQHARSSGLQQAMFTFGGRYTDHIVRVRGSLRIQHRRLEVIWSTGDPSILSAGS